MIINFIPISENNCICQLGILKSAEGDIKYSLHIHFNQDMQCLWILPFTHMYTCTDTQLKTKNQNLSLTSPLLCYYNDYKVP